MLIGPKDSGKTYIGLLVEKQTDISFLRIERIWLALKPKEDGWQKVKLQLKVIREHSEGVGVL